MTLSPPRAGRLSMLALAVVYTGLTFGTLTAPTHAMAADGPYYTATLAQPTDEDGTVATGIAWACKGTTCVANKGSSRPMRICRGLARDVGEIATFTANGKELPADKLAKCNGK